MFTGIIDHCGKILKIESIPSGLKFTIQTHFPNLELGESIAVNGICLTVTTLDKNIFCCDISPESIEVTTAKYFKVNQLVNLERALLPSSRIGGHFVSGHIDDIYLVKSIQQNDGFVKMIFSGLKEEDKLLIIKKGSIAINGVSLTINDVANNEFNVMLIPHTLKILFAYPSSTLKQLN